MVNAAAIFNALELAKPKFNTHKYLFALQVKRDLVTGTLLCSENTAALLASYVVQGKYLVADMVHEIYANRLH
ncbi:uncharacterized protein DEA37_0013069 [Paragonimus westermani]|uniref:FERM central domain-containing protein n=1 Tax=Paragonimus westermani TaxID=34504 RepID=A0A5J4NQC2_9TREM|nr:uncharacterized protein DEA37_0013069 [Paragonimus westermani]